VTTDPSPANVVTVLLAAGRSKRMGRPKLLLPVGGRPCIERVIRAAGAGGGTVLVVVGPHNREALQAFERPGVRLVLNADPDRGMTSSLQEGLRAARVLQPEWIFFTPADLPRLAADDFACLLERASWPVSRSYSIFLPVFQGRRGHPVLLRGEHLEGLADIPPETPLNRWIRENDQEVMLVGTPRPGVLQDMNTPGDYLRLR
jgi:molybdenum cofactor cytidylyltransferase